MTMTTTIHDFSELVHHLHERAYVTAGVDSASRTVEIATELGALVLRWDVDVPILQLIHLLDVPIVPQRTGAVEGAVCRVNNSLPLPGFGVEVARGVIYYRVCVVRSADDSVVTEVLDRMIAYAIATAVELLPRL